MIYTALLVRVRVTIRVLSVLLGAYSHKSNVRVMVLIAVSRTRTKIPVVRSYQVLRCAVQYHNIEYRISQRAEQRTVKKGKNTCTLSLSETTYCSMLYKLVAQGSIYECFFSPHFDDAIRVAPQKGAKRHEYQADQKIPSRRPPRCEQQ